MPMYESFFGLKECPFNVTPDPRFLYFSRHHQSALSSLVYGVVSRRGFIQLTGRSNYLIYGQALKMDLIHQPELANTPTVAAAVLCEYLKKRETQFTQAMQLRDLARARKMVNGGSHGLDVFKASCEAWPKVA